MLDDLLGVSQLAAEEAGHERHLLPAFSGGTVFHTTSEILAYPSGAFEGLLA